MAATLAQIIGVEQGVRASTEQWWKLVRDSLHKENLLTGLDQTYEPEPENLPQPPKRQRVQINVEKLLAEARVKLGRYFDVTASKDWGNMGDGGARADVSVEGRVILADVPATFLLFLLNRLGELAADIKKIPTQSLAEDWEPATETGIWRTRHEKRASTKKVMRHLVIVPPTTEHPAQVAQVADDEIAGWWTTVKMTSAPTVEWQDELLTRIAALREGVQNAIYDANKLQVTDQHVSAQIFGWIFDGEVRS